MVMILAGQIASLVCVFICSIWKEWPCLLRHSPEFIYMKFSALYMAHSEESQLLITGHAMCPHLATSEAETFRVQPHPVKATNPAR